jgi:hypothetical protein
MLRLGITAFTVAALVLAAGFTFTIGSPLTHRQPPFRW